MGPNSFLLNKAHENAIVTFVIPSIGRESIKKTISSLLAQTECQWEAVIIFDGHNPSPDWIPSDSRLRIYTIPKTGERSQAGILRNFGMTKARSRWIAFVDDDDVLASDYISRLLEEIRLDSDLEAVVFRMSAMYLEKFYILPEKEDRALRKYQVGISFAICRHLFEAGFWFQPSRTEDFDLLKKLDDAKKKMVISPHVTYYVKDVRPRIPLPDFPRVYIN